MKVLNIVDTAYRATLEEQDDTIVWISAAMRTNANAPVDLLLRGNAVNYAVKAQDASGLSFGDQRQTQPPQLAKDLEKLREKGAKIFLVREALRERGIEDGELISGVEFVARDALAKLFGEYDQVWHW
jgi:sulfur relay (sulfurtransferase) DsrF/TusC family protein